MSDRFRWTPHQEKPIWAGTVWPVGTSNHLSHLNYLKYFSADMFYARFALKNAITYGTANYKPHTIISCVCVFCFALVVFLCGNAACCCLPNFVQLLPPRAIVPGLHVSGRCWPGLTSRPGMKRQTEKNEWEIVRVIHVNIIPEVDANISFCRPLSSCGQTQKTEGETHISHRSNAKSTRTKVNIYIKYIKCRTLLNVRDADAYSKFVYATIFVGHIGRKVRRLYKTICYVSCQNWQTFKKKSTFSFRFSKLIMLTV